MKIMKTIVAATLVALNGGAYAAAGDAYPTRPVRLLVPFAPGGGTDLVARTIARGLSDKFGQTVVVDNRGGAGGVIGADMVAKAPADGYTLLMGTPGPMTINPNVEKKMPYDTMKDFYPVSLSTISPFVFVVHPSVSATTVKDFIALAKAKPRSFNFGSAGNGSVAHLSGEQMKSLAGIDMVHVPYKGSSLAMTDLLGGQIQVMFENQPVVLPQIKAGKIRGMAVGTLKRSALLPELPTMHEAGVPGYESSTAFGVLAPAKTPEAIVQRLSKEIAGVLQSADVKERLAAQGLEAVGSTPAQYTTHLRDELAKYAKIIKAAGIKMD